MCFHKQAQPYFAHELKGPFIKIKKKCNKILMEPETNESSWFWRKGHSCLCEISQRVHFISDRNHLNAPHAVIMIFQLLSRNFSGGLECDLSFANSSIYFSTSAPSAPPYTFSNVLQHNCIFMLGTVTYIINPEARSYRKHRRSYSSQLISLWDWWYVSIFRFCFVLWPLFWGLVWYDWLL